MTHIANFIDKHIGFYLVLAACNAYGCGFIIGAALVLI